MFIYEIRNTVNNRVYIGQTTQTDPTKRWKHHLYSLRNNKHGNDYLQKAWNKYGEHNFAWKVIDYPVTDASQRDLNFLECRHMTLNPDNYNLRSGGSSGSPSTETRMKIANTLRGKPSANKGKSKSAETKEKIRQANLGKKQTVETRLKRSISSKLRGISDEHKAKIRAANKRTWTGRKHTAQTSERMKEAWVRRKAKATQ